MKFRTIATCIGPLLTVLAPGFAFGQTGAPITFSDLTAQVAASIGAANPQLGQLVNNQTANKFLASPSSGTGVPGFRGIAGLDLPLPGSGALGGVQALAPSSHQFVTGISSSTGAPSAAQPAFSDLSGTASAAQLPAPTASTLGGVQAASPTTHQFLTGVSTLGVPQAAQPAFSDLSGTASAAQLPAPTTGAIGGVKAVTGVAHRFVASIDTTGTPQLGQPAFSDLSGTASAAQLPAPTASTLGGVQAASPVTHQFLTGVSTLGVPQAAQPAAADITGLAPSATTDTTNAANVTIAWPAGAASPVSGLRWALQANLNVYVNQTAGNSDANDCLSATYVSGTHGPCTTPQRAIDFVVQNVDPRGFIFTVNIGAGTYAFPSAGSYMMNLTGPIIGKSVYTIQGNGSTINNPSGATILQASTNQYVARAKDGAIVTLQGLRAECLPGGLGEFQVKAQGTVDFGEDVEFGSCPGGVQVNATQGGAMNFIGVLANTYNITGGAAYFLNSLGGMVGIAGTFNVLNSIAYSKDFFAVTGGITNATNLSVPLANGVTVTGTRYVVSGNGLVWDDSARDMNTVLPGNVNGVPRFGVNVPGINANVFSIGNGVYNFQPAAAAASTNGVVAILAGQGSITDGFTGGDIRLVPGTATTSFYGDIDMNGHVASTQPTVPTASTGCGGAQPVNKSTDESGRITIGATSPGPNCLLTFTFGNGYHNAPHCNATDETSHTVLACDATTAAMTIYGVTSGHAISWDISKGFK